MSKRIEYIDIAKGFAIICVVFGHVLCYDLYDMELAAKQSPLLQFISSFHMPLFIFLSGLVSITDIDWKKIPCDIWKRIRTILLQGVIVDGIYSLVFYHNFSYIQDNMKGEYWYLWVLFVYYLISYLLTNRGAFSDNKVPYGLDSMVRRASFD